LCLRSSNGGSTRIIRNGLNRIGWFGPNEVVGFQSAVDV